MFPFDIENLKYLLSICDLDSYSIIFDNIGDNVPDSCSRDEYKEIVDIMCGKIGLQKSPTDDDIIKYAEKRDHVRSGNYEYYWTTFYTGEYYIPNSKDILNKIHTLNANNSPCDRKYLTPISCILRAFKKRDPDSYLKLLHSDSFTNPEINRWFDELRYD